MIHLKRITAKNVWDILELRVACWLSYELENTAAQRLYHSFGFEPTGDRDGDELIAALKL